MNHKGDHQGMKKFWPTLGESHKSAFSTEGLSFALLLLLQTAEGLFQTNCWMLTGYNWHEHNEHARFPCWGHFQVAFCNSRNKVYSFISLIKYSLKKTAINSVLLKQQFFFDRKDKTDRLILRNWTDKYILNVRKFYEKNFKPYLDVKTSSAFRKLLPWPYDKIHRNKRQNSATGSYFSVGLRLNIYKNRTRSLKWEYLCLCSLLVTLC